MYGRTANRNTRLPINIFIVYQGSRPIASRKMPSGMWSRERLVSHPGIPEQAACRKGYFRPAKILARLLSMT